MNWASDGGAIHLFDLVDDAPALRSGIERAAGAARELGLSLLYAECYEGDAAVVILRSCGFETDDAEKTVVEGRLTQRLTFVKLLPG